MNLSSALARNATTKATRSCSPAVSVGKVRSRAMADSIAGLPIIAMPPPIAIIEAETKKATLWRRLSIIVASKMRG